MSDYPKLVIVSVPTEARGTLDDETVASVWAIMSEATASAVEAAEDVFGPGTGPLKHAWVLGRLRETLRRCEKGLDGVLVPAISRVLFDSLDAGLDWLIEGAVARFYVE